MSDPAWVGSPPLLEDLALSQGESKPSAPKVLDMKATPGRSFLHAEDFLLPRLVIDTQPAAPQDIIRFVSASSPSRKEKYHTLTHTCQEVLEFGMNYQRSLDAASLFFRWPETSDTC